MSEDFDRLKAQKDRIEREQRAATLAPALSIARRAVNGWACYAKRDIEHNEITALHREISELGAGATCSTPALEYFGRLILDEGALTERSVTGTFVYATDVRAEAPSRSTPAPPQLIAENVDAYLHALNSGASSPEVRLYQSRIVTLACQWRNETRGSEGAVPAQQICQHQLEKESAFCLHGYAMGATCKPCIVGCPDCWDVYSSASAFGPHPQKRDFAAGPPGAAEAQTMRGLLIDRDATLRIELRTYLDTLTITGDTIGDIRRRLFMPWDSEWNGWVRDETASREVAPAAPRDEKET